MREAEVTTHRARKNQNSNERREKQETGMGIGERDQPIERINKRGARIGERERPNRRGAFTHSKGTMVPARAQRNRRRSIPGTMGASAAEERQERDTMRHLKRVFRFHRQIGPQKPHSGQSEKKSISGDARAALRLFTPFY